MPGENGERASARQSFFIATEEGGALFSDQVIRIAKSTGDKSRVYTAPTSGGHYSDPQTVGVSVATLMTIFKEHGYDYVSAEDLKARQEGQSIPAPAPSI